MKSKSIYYRFYKDKSNNSLLYFIVNKINSKSIYFNLSKLIIIEEILIAKVYVEIEISYTKSY